MTSTAYRQSSEARPDALKIDPENRLLWRVPVRRLEAEIVRDAMLAVAGTLDLSMHGEPVGTETKSSGEIVPKEDTKGGRRSIYQLVRRSAPQTILNAFGAPAMEINCTRRSPYTSVTQALALMNGEFVGSHAEHFARRVLKYAPANDRAALEHAFRLALARSPASSELDMLLTFLERQALHYMNVDPETRRLRIYADLCQTLLSSNEFMYVD
jgi:hypothetical protein